MDRERFIPFFYRDLDEDFYMRIRYDSMMHMISGAVLSQIIPIIFIKNNHDKKNKDLV